MLDYSYLLNYLFFFFFSFFLITKHKDASTCNVIEQLVHEIQLWGYTQVHYWYCSAVICPLKVLFPLAPIIRFYLPRFENLAMEV